MENSPKLIKKHGMSSEKASRVKKRGTNKEYIYASLIGGQVVKGIKKEDVLDSFGMIHSIKGGSEIQKKSGRHGKWQIFLYKKSRFEQEQGFLGSDIFMAILNLFPQTYKQYQEDKQAIKEKIKLLMKKLKEILLIKKNLILFMDKAFFDSRVDFFVIYDDNGLTPFYRTVS